MAAAPPGPIVDAAPGLWARAGSAHWLTITGMSMAPFLRPGDEVLVQYVLPEPAESGRLGPPLELPLRPGDIAVMRQPTALFVHRVLRASPLITQGDNNASPDPGVPLEAVLGRVTAVRRAGHLVQLARPRWRFVGLLTAIGLQALSWLNASPPFAQPLRALAGVVRRGLFVVRWLASR
jgi:hypothetical protein